VRFIPIYGRQAFKQPDGKFKFWGGADGGIGRRRARTRQHAH